MRLLKVNYFPKGEGEKLDRMYGRSQDISVFLSFSSVFLLSYKGEENDHDGSKSWQRADERPWLFAASVIRRSMRDRPHDRGHRNERLESWMRRKPHVQSRGRPMEKRTCCTSPAANPTA